MLKIQDKNKIPIIRTVDLLVVGGSLAGLSAAVYYAKRNKKVFLIESNTFLGYEMTLYQRPWITHSGDDVEYASHWFPFEASQEMNNKITFNMDNLKTKFEDILLDNQIEFLYASRVVGITKNNSDYQVTIGNKSGRQCILASQILDTSETGIIQRLSESGANESTGNREIIVRRTIQLTNVKDNYLQEYNIPVNGIADKVEVYAGGHSNDHVYLDIPINIMTENRSLKEDLKIEYKARKISLETVAYMLNNVSEFSEAVIGPGSLQVLRGDTIDPVEILKAGEKTAINMFDSDLHVISINNQAVLTDFPDDKRNNKLSKSAISYKEESQFKELYDYKMTELDLHQLPVAIQTDVLVVGGGTSGAVAAWSAAGEGVKTALVEMNSALGGSTTVGGVHSYWFGNRASYTKDIDHRVREWGEKLNYPFKKVAWTEDDVWSMEIKAFALLEMCLERNIDVLFNSLTIGSLVENDTVKGVAIATPYGMYAVQGRITIDATGDGDIAAFAGAKLIDGNCRDRMTLWGSLAQFRKPGFNLNNFSSTVDISNIYDYTRFIIISRKRSNSKETLLADHGTYVAPRETRHIIGREIQTIMDQLQIKKYQDTISICFSNYDPKGLSVADIIHFGVLPPQMEIELPYRVYIPEKLEQIYVTGKAISCTHDAEATIRMIDDLQQQGGAIGLAAALSIKEGVSPGNLLVRKLQKRLVQIGVIPESILTRETRETRENRDKKPEYEKLINNLRGNEPFEWIKEGWLERKKETPVIIQLCSADSEMIIPLLIKAHKKATGKRRLLLARLLVWHSQNEGLTDLIAEINRQLDNEPLLPVREGSLRFVQVPPDHGAMPEIVYLIRTLSRVKDKEVIPVFKKLIERIQNSNRDYYNARQGIFYYINSIPYVAERLTFSEFIPLLNKLLKLPELNNVVQTEGISIDIIKERFAYLFLTISRALARCGSKKGLELLARLVEDNRLLIARSARDELIELTGKKFGLNKQKWLEGINDCPETFNSIPWEKELK